MHQVVLCSVWDLLVIWREFLLEPEFEESRFGTPS